jgi:hypothetical protein
MFSISPLKTMSSMLFDVIVELIAIVAKKLDAVVLVGIVGRRRTMPASARSERVI